MNKLDEFVKMQEKLKEKIEIENFTPENVNEFIYINSLIDSSMKLEEGKGKKCIHIEQTNGYSSTLESLTMECLDYITNIRENSQEKENIFYSKLLNIQSAMSEVKLKLN